ncbi:Aste57867_11468 [Aphanomyces stellatus]|uniref:Aste57867_11468 protein n=1 Tax=Aphanomyces stellatus TaxID=120398 RepID=A0A485KT25_9STRA|nr:hypothetical protein As57867_011425 [Aphanomyces stellatus]VFT88329.1 Aste57867_11468 [Aphanomyces stellatus]
MNDESIEHDIIERLLFDISPGDEGASVVEGDTVQDADAAVSEDSIPDRKDETDMATVAKRKRRRTTIKAEIAYLKLKQDDLQNQLDKLKPETMDIQPATSVWEGRAKDQMQAAKKAMRENAVLRTMLQDQLKTTQALERLLKKKPRLEMSPDFADDEWREWRLDTDPARRRHAMQSISDHVYHRLESEFIQNGVYDLAPGQSGIVIRSTKMTLALWFNFLQCAVYDVPYEQMQTVAWAISCFEMPMKGSAMLQSNGEVLERVPGHLLVYLGVTSRATVQQHVIWTEGRWIFRMYVETARTVIVYRSILDDLLYPHGDGHLRDNLLGWVVLEPHPTDPTKTRQYYMHQFTPPATSVGVATAPLPQGELTEFLLCMLQSHMDRVVETIVKPK